MPTRHLHRMARGAAVPSSSSPSSVSGSGFQRAFQLPRQPLTPLDVGPFDSPRGYGSSASGCSDEHKQNTPPPNGSLLEFLRDHQSPPIEPKNGSENECTRAGQGEHDEDAAMEAEGTKDAVAPPARRALRPRSAKSPTSRAAHTATATAEASPVDTAAQPHAAAAKRSRYLRESDRRSIIRRIDNGEKQAALAKEFGVTRAAICHINKNRVEILTRSMRADVHSSARHPKRGMYSTSKSSFFRDAPSGELPMVVEVRSSALAIHLTALRRKETDSRQYRAMADRAFRVLLEEALASVPTRQIEVLTVNDVQCPGVVADLPTCAIFMSESGYPMLEAFRSIQPDSPTGFMTLEHAERDEAARSDDDESVPRVTLRKMCAPLDLRSHNIFLLDATCASGAEATVAIQSLLDFGASESNIVFVTLVISVRAVGEICGRFPSVRVVSAAIDPEVTKDLAIRPGIGNFQDRYFNTTTIRHNDSGSNVDL